MSRMYHMLFNQLDHSCDIWIMFSFTIGGITLGSWQRTIVAARLVWIMFSFTIGGITLGSWNLNPKPCTPVQGGAEFESVHHDPTWHQRYGYLIVYMYVIKTLERVTCHLQVNTVSNASIRPKPRTTKSMGTSIGRRLVRLPWFSCMNHMRFPKFFELKEGPQRDQLYPSL
jgi:hypothetical protein